MQRGFSRLAFMNLRPASDERIKTVCICQSMGNRNTQNTAAALHLGNSERCQRPVFERQQKRINLFNEMIDRPGFMEACGYFRHALFTIADRKQCTSMGVADTEPAIQPLPE